MPGTSSAVILVTEIFFYTDMNKSNILFFGLAGFLVYSIFAKQGAANRLQFFVNKVSLRFSGITPIVDIIVGIHNPTNQNLRIGGMVGELYINNNYAAQIYGYQMTDVKGLGVSYLPISARLSVFGVVNQVVEIVNAISNGGLDGLKNQTLGFKGYVNAEGVTIPLNFTHKVL